jgi:hypothetical protein
MAGKVLQDGLGWLTGLVDKVLSYNIGHAVYSLMLSGILITYMSCAFTQEVSKGRIFHDFLSCSCRGFIIEKGSATAKILQLKRNLQWWKIALG